MPDSSTPRKKAGRPKATGARDLRVDLLKISLELLNEGGPGALSMREVARRTGCTHQAPYHHFPDRESILAALVREGFDTLTLALQAANDLAAVDGGRAALHAGIMAYVGFALTQPGVFRIMFRPDMCNYARFFEVTDASARASAQLGRLNAMIFGEQAGPASATLLWAQVHGLACLLLDGPLAGQFATQQQRQMHLLEVADALVNFLEECTGG